MGVRVGRSGEVVTITPTGPSMGGGTSVNRLGVRGRWALAEGGGILAGGTDRRATEPGRPARIGRPGPSSGVPLASDWAPSARTPPDNPPPEPRFATRSGRAPAP